MANIKVTNTLAKLAKEVNKGVAEQDPYTLAIDGQKVITFKNPNDVSFFTMGALDDNMSLPEILAVISELLSEEDLELFKAAKPSVLIVGTVLQEVYAHYTPEG